jgi:hypothetical protein
MTKTASPTVKAKYWREFKAIGENEGIEVYDWEQTGSGHVRLYLRKDGVERFCFAASSPSDFRNMNEVKLNMRRAFR